MNSVDYRFVGSLATRLEGFSVKQTQPYRANFRCIICGDSKKTKTKKRGWILEKDNRAIYYCHNCNASMGLGNFLKREFPPLYNEYIIEGKLNFKNDGKKLSDYDKPKEKEEPKVLAGNGPLKKLKKISQLKHNHPVKRYIDKRRIPSHQHFRMYVAPKFNKWVNQIIPDKMNEKYDEGRLVIPFFDEKGTMFGFTGRSFKKDAYLRYITIMIDEDRDKIFGLDQVDFDKEYYVVEGALDSMFLTNSIAMAGASGRISSLTNSENAVMIFDNEPRNKDVVRQMEKMVDQGRKICIWPNTIKEKDINDMVLGGLSPSQVESIIRQNTHSGLSAKMSLYAWRKIK